MAVVNPLPVNPNPVWSPALVLPVFQHMRLLTSRMILLLLSASILTISGLVTRFVLGTVDIPVWQVSSFIQFAREDAVDLAFAFFHIFLALCLLTYGPQAKALKSAVDFLPILFDLAIVWRGVLPGIGMLFSLPTLDLVWKIPAAKAVLLQCGRSLVWHSFARLVLPYRLRPGPALVQQAPQSNGRNWRRVSLFIAILVAVGAVAFRVIA